MAEKSRTRSTTQSQASTFEYEQFDLDSTMKEFLEDEEPETGKSIWNIATISGLVMLFMGLTFALNIIGLPIGEFLSDLSTNLVGTSALPLIGGVLITLVGFGYLVGDRKKARKMKKAKKKAEKKAHAKQATGKSYSDIPGGETSTSGSRLRNDLDIEDGDTGEDYEYFDFDKYGYRHSKKLMRSRSDKKISGVCGGLARFFGISSTVVRLIFIVSFFMYGTSVLIYFALALALPKEPIDMMDE